MTEFDALEGKYKHLFDKYNEPEEKPQPEPEQDSGLFDGFNRTIQQDQALLHGLVGAGGSMLEKATGWEVAKDVRDWGIEGYQRNMEEAQQYAPEVESLAEADSLSDYGSWAWDRSQSLIPTVAGILATGGIGGVIGGSTKIGSRKIAKLFAKDKLPKLYKEAAEEQLKKGIGQEAAKEIADTKVKRLLKTEVGQNLVKREGAKIGTMTGAVGAESAIETGAMYGEQVERHGAEDANPFSSALIGTLSGATSLVGGEGMLIRKFFGDSGLKALREAYRQGKIKFTKVAGKGILKTVPGEYVQEGFQEFLSEVNSKVNDPQNVELFSPENIAKYKESAAVGGLGGVMFGVGGAAGKARQAGKQEILAKEQSDKEADILSQLDERQLEEQQQRQEQDRLEAQQDEISKEQEAAASQDQLRGEILGSDPEYFQRHIASTQNQQATQGGTAVDPMSLEDAQEKLQILGAFGENALNKKRRLEDDVQKIDQMSAPSQADKKARDDAKKRIRLLDKTLKDNNREIKDVQRQIAGEQTEVSLDTSTENKPAEKPAEPAVAPGVKSEGQEKPAPLVSEVKEVKEKQPGNLKRLLSKDTAAEEKPVKTTKKKTAEGQPKPKKKKKPTKAKGQPKQTKQETEKKSSNLRKKLDKNKQPEQQPGTEIRQDTTQNTPIPESFVEGQAGFVEKKLQELGSVEAVDKFYNKETDTDKYAQARAREVFGEPTPVQEETVPQEAPKETQRKDKAKSTKQDKPKKTKAQMKAEMQEFFADDVTAESLEAKRKELKEKNPDMASEIDKQIDAKIKKLTQKAEEKPVVPAADEGAKAPKKKRAKGEITDKRSQDLKRGDVIRDAEGNEFAVWDARHGVVEAHPVQDGKPQVSSDTAIKINVSDAARARNADVENTRSDPFFVAPQKKKTPTKSKGKGKKPTKSQETPDLKGLMKTAQDWRGAADQAAKKAKSDKKAAQNIAKQTDARGLENYLVKQGASKEDAKSVADAVNQGQVKPNTKAQLENFSGEAWAQEALGIQQNTEKNQGQEPKPAPKEETATKPEESQGKSAKTAKPLKPKTKKVGKNKVELKEDGKFLAVETTDEQGVHTQKFPAENSERIKQAFDQEVEKLKARTKTDPSKTSKKSKEQKAEQAETLNVTADKVSKRAKATGEIETLETNEDANITEDELDGLTPAQLIAKAAGIQLKTENKNKVRQAVEAGTNETVDTAIKKAFGKKSRIRNLKSGNKIVQTPNHATILVDKNGIGLPEGAVGSFENSDVVNRKLKNGERINYGGIIRLAKEDQGTLNHEQMHAALRMALDKSQQTFLRKHFTKQKYKDKWAKEIAGYPGEFQQFDEILANEYEQWSGQDNDAPHRFLPKIRDRFKKIRKFLFPGGESVQSLMEKVKSGEIWTQVQDEGGGSSRAMYKADKKPVFYSQMQSKLDQKLPGKGSPQQLKQTIQSLAKKGEFKQEELEWSGVETWLDQQDGKVTKQQVLDYLRANQIQVEEVRKSGKEEDKDIYRGDLESEYVDQRIDDFEISWDEEENGYVVYDPNGDVLHDRGGDVEVYEDEASASAVMKDIFYADAAAMPFDELMEITGREVEFETEGGGTRYEDLQNPGGENYREMVLTLPTKETRVDTTSRDDAYKRFDAGEITREERNRLIDEATIQEGTLPNGIFRSSHWDESNVLAHVRFNERADSEGNRVLFIEELQSDWHQEGRKEGYGEVQKTRFHIAYKNGETLGAGFETKQEAQEVLENTFEDRLNEFEVRSKTETEQSVPDAPFKTTWPMLAMKRMLRYAADNGFEKVAWHGKADSIQKAEGWGKLEQNEKGQWVIDNDNDVTAIVDRYLTKIPQTINKYTKKWGAKVSTSQLQDRPIQIGEGRKVRDIANELYGTTDVASLNRQQADEVNKVARRSQHDAAFQLTAHSIPITDKMAGEITEGQVMFKLGRNNDKQNLIDRQPAFKDILGSKQKGVQQKIRDITKEAEAAEGSFLKNLFRILGKKIIVNGVDRQREIKRLEEAHKNRIGTKDGEGLYMSTILANNPDVTFSSMLQDGPIEYVEGAPYVKTKDKGLMPMMVELGGEDSYLWGINRTLRRAKHEQENNDKFAENERFWTDEKIKEVEEAMNEELANRPGLADKFAKADERYETLNEALLDFAVESRWIGEADKEWLNSAVYTPLYRLFDSLTEDQRTLGPNIGKQYIPELKRLEGSKSGLRTGDPIENIITNWAHILEASLRNKNRLQAMDMMVELGLANQVEKVHNQDRALTVKRDGHQEVYETSDPDLFRALTDMNSTGMDNIIVNAFRKAKTWLTLGATWGPAFRQANFLRDTLQTWVVSDHFVPFVDSFKGLKKAWQNHPDAIAVKSAGGTFNSGYTKGNDPGSITEYAEELIQGKTGKKVKKVSFRYLLQKWAEIGDAMENAARIQLYSNLKMAGKTHQEASFASKDLLDFSRRGGSPSVQLAVQVVPFLNARVQGLDKLGRSAKENKKRFFLNGSMLAAGSLLLRSLFGDEERRKELKGHEKWNYYYFSIGDAEFRIPKPFEVGAIFSSLPEVIADSVFGEKDAKYFWEFMKFTTFQTFALQGPQLLMPMVEQAANRDFFRGRPIVGMGMENLPYELQKKPWTSNTVSLVTKAMDTVMPDVGLLEAFQSPKRFQKLLDDYFSTFASAIYTTSDILGEWAGVYPSDPAWTLQDYPAIGRFLVNEISRSPRQVGKLYDFVEEVDKANAELRYYRDTGDMAKAKNVIKNNTDLLRFKKATRAIRKQFRTVYDRLDNIWTDQTLSAKEKRSRMDKLVKYRNDLAKKYFNAIRESGGRI